MCVCLLPTISLLSWNSNTCNFEYLILFFYVTKALFLLSSNSVQFSCVRLFVTPLTALQASLSITNSQSLFRLMSIDLVVPSNRFTHCRPLLLLPSILPSIRVFSNESVFCIRWLKYWSFSFSISPSNEYSGLIPFIIYLFILFFCFFIYFY